MTGSPDGDVARALASINSTPLKYHSFGVVSVRPPGSEPDGYANGSRAGLPPSGEGTAERYRAHAVSSVFPLLGLALPEAFQIDVEPVWPVGPPVSEQGILLDRMNGSPAPHTPGSGGADGWMPPPSFTPYSPPAYTPPPSGVSEAGPAAPPAFSMPPWLDPLPPANPLHHLPEAPVSSYLPLDPHQNFPGWVRATVEPPVTRPADPAPVRRLNAWGDETAIGESPGLPFSVEPTLPPSSTEFSPFLRPGFGQAADPTAAPMYAPSWLETAKPAEAEPFGHPLAHDWTSPADPIIAPPQVANAAESTHSFPQAIPDLTPLANGSMSEPYAPVTQSLQPQSPEPWDRLAETAGFSPFHDRPAHHEPPRDEPVVHVPPEQASFEPMPVPTLAPPAVIDETPVFLAQPGLDDAYAPSRHQAFDAEPTWHDAPSVHDSFTTGPHGAPAIETASEHQDHGVTPGPAWQHAFGQAATPAEEPTPTAPPGGASPGSAKGRPLADLFRTLGAGAPGPHSGAP